MNCEIPGRVYCFCLLILLLSFCSCKEDKRKKTIRDVVAEWTGREILFPEGIPCQFLGRDTCCIDPTNQNHKILLYVDSTGCSICRLKLTEWNAIMAEADTAFSEPVDFLFFFQPQKRDEQELQLWFRNIGFNHPVFIDRHNEIDRLNKFPSQVEYQCFLLDAHNKVIMLGNPSYNTGIWQLFKKYIKEGNKKIINQGKKEESLTFFNRTTLPPALPAGKGGDKGTEIISMSSVPG